MEAEAELSAFRAAAHDRAFVALSLEVVTQALQRGHGCGWGLGDAAKVASWAGPAAGDCAGISGPRLLDEEAARDDRRVRVVLGQVDLIGVPETALATARLLVEGFGDSKAGLDDDRGDARGGETTGDGGIGGAAVLGTMADAKEGRAAEQAGPSDPAEARVGKGGGGSGLAHEEERVVAVGGPEASVDQFWIHWAGRGEAHGGVYTAVFLAPHTETFRVVAWGDRFFLDKVTCAFSNHALFNFDPQQTKNALICVHPTFFFPSSSYFVFVGAGGRCYYYY